MTKKFCPILSSEYTIQIGQDILYIWYTKLKWNNAVWSELRDYEARLAQVNRLIPSELTDSLLHYAPADNDNDNVDEYDDDNDDNDDWKWDEEDRRHHNPVLDKVNYKKYQKEIYAILLFEISPLKICFSCF